MKKSELISIFENAIKNNVPFIAVVVYIDGANAGEIIINPHANFKSKLDYYRAVYDDNLRLIHNKKIRIVDCVTGGSFEQIQEKLLK